MTDAASAVGMDRLPWLDDEPVRRAEPRPRDPKPPRAKSSIREYAGWAVAAVLLVAGGSYWLGSQSWPGSDEQSIGSSASQPEATVTLPAARSTKPPVVEQPLAAEPASTVRTPPPQAASPLPRRRPAVVRHRTLKPMEMKNSDLSKTIAEQEQAAKPESPASETPKVAPTPPPPVAKTRPLASGQQLKVWPARVSSGASGRLVQIGAFGSRQQAKLGWRRMKRSYPAVARLPAVVVESRNSRGKRFYRFQIGTTSQAHSEVLCQRMQSIKFSCAVVGLPWKSKVER